MNKLRLDNVEWKVFKIRDIFEVFEGTNGIQTPTGAYIKKDNLYKGDTPRITVRDTTNGIDSYNYSDDKNYRKFKNFISVSFLGSVFYHPYEASLDMKVHALKIKNKDLSSNIAKFLIRTIKNNTGMSSYGNQISSTDLAQMRILLPVDAKNNPNWKFMEEYIKQEQKDIAEKIIDYYEQKIIGIDFDLVGFENVEWKEFSLNEIFNKIQRGKRLKKSDHVFGTIPYVSSTSLNNGVDGFIGNEDRARKFKSNLTLANSGSVGSCFYQEFEYIASDHVTTLTLENPNKYVYLFMSTIIKRLEDKYSFNREINDKRINREKIVLPIDDNMDPNWDYMSKYMQKIEVEKIKKTIEYIKKSYLS